MAVTARPEISKILLDLGIEPVDVYAVDNAEQTYLSALREGINTIEVASKDKKGDQRSRILRDEIKRIREKKRKVNVDKLFARRQVIPTNRIKPQALLPASKDDEKEKGGIDKKAHSILDTIIGILKIGNKQDKKEAEIERKERAAKRRKVRENLLESTKGIAKVGKNLVSKIVSPFSNILGAIGKFLKNVLAGVLFNVLFEWFTDEKNQKKIKTLTRFFKDWWPALAGAALLFLTPLGTILGGLIGFLSWALPALVSLMVKNPWIAGSALLASVFGYGALDAELRKGDLRQDFNKTDNESITTVDEFQQENKNIKDPTKKKVNMSWLQGILELGSTPGMMPFKKGGMTKGPSHAQGGTDINVEGGEFIFRKESTKFWGARTLQAMNRMGGMATRSKPKRKKVRPEYEGGGLVEIKSMFNRISTMPFISDDRGKFIPSKAKGMVALDIPVNQQNTKTVVMPEKRISKESQVPTKIGSKTIPDIMIVNGSHYRSMTTRSLGIHDLVGV
tara:strand:- start:1199 stop:2719 length:1521 start_codon:yes stop_codon:yes gene_type:complete